MKMTALMLALAAAAVTLSACETVKGVGKDITNASQDVQDKL